MKNTLHKKANQIKPNHKNELYLKAYQILDQVTPLKSDCGLLCNKACCDGGEDDLGMYLFPGEELILSESSHFRILPTDILLENDSNILLANCDGKCDRKFRPLSCRIFPLTPYLTYQDILTVDLDIRAAGICPLINGKKSPPIHPDFIRAVRKAVRLLSKDPEILNFIEKLSRILDEYAQLPDLF